MSLKVNNLIIEYPDQLVFNGVNLQVEDHEIVAIRTEVLDGATSLLKAIAGLLDGVAGEVKLNGTNLLGKIDDSLRHKIGYVYEDNGLVSIYSAFQNVSLPLQFHTNLNYETITAEVRKVCKFLNIDARTFDKHPHELNDVQTRMINLARSLVVKPKLLLIDELEGGMPDDYLDATMSKLKQYQQSHPMGIIITTASDIVMRRADRRLRINNFNLTAETELDKPIEGLNSELIK